MPEPPVPGITALLLAIAAKLLWRATTRDPAGNALGVFTDSSGDHSLLLHGDAPGNCAWSIVATPPAGFGPFLLSQQTYDVLHTGALEACGSIAYSGQSYRIRAWWDGAHWTALAATT